MTNGVRQGGVLSPILFNVYFDELLQRLQDHDIGCHVGTTFVGELGYADDLTLPSPSLRGLQKAADICNDLAQEYSVKFNSKKTQCMCVGKDGEFFQGNIHLDGGKLKWVNCARHLANLITWNLKDDDDIQLKRGYFYGSVNNLCAKFKVILNNPDVASKLVYALCCSFYGSQQWDFSSKSFDDICTTWQKAVRRIFNLPYRTHRYLLPYVVECEHIRDNLINRFKNVFDSFMSSSNAIVQLLAFNAVSNNTPKGLNRKFVCSRNSTRTDENGKGNGLLLCSSLHIRSDHWHIPQFQRDDIDVLINSVCTEYVFSSLISGARLWKVDLWLNDFVVPLTCNCVQILCTCALYFLCLYVCIWIVLFWGTTWVRINCWTELNWSCPVTTATVLIGVSLRKKCNIWRLFAGLEISI